VESSDSVPPDLTEERLDTVVVGAGFAGLYMLQKLRGIGHTALLLEAAPEIGGTWYWNRYPGARCDAESLQYSYSFDSDLEQEWHWTERYATQPEILRYLNHVADRFDLRRSIVLDTRVAAAHWEESTRRWTVSTSTGRILSARYCIFATGSLSVPRVPDFDGLDDFRGATYVTAQWPEHPVDFTGQRVAVVGTGSSGIQVVPVIARDAARLTLFQRSPNFVLPAFNGPMDPETEARHKANYPELRRKARRTALGLLTRITPQPSALAVSDEEREQAFQVAWEAGGNALSGAFLDLAVDLAANEYAAEFVRRKICEQVHDREVAERLMPRDHPIFGRRPCVDTEYYDTFNRDNVELVDIRASPIARFEPGGIRTVDGLHEFDAVVFATGFDAITGALARIDIRGREGCALSEKWADGPRTYLGLATEGFPNLFMITGPGSPGVLSNVVVSIEQHVNWIGDLVRHAEGLGARLIEPTAQAEADWGDEVNRAASATLVGKTHSWYMGGNVPGKPQVFMPYSGGVGQYHKICDRIAARGFLGFDLR
jgi:cyclohexanone monooxygenase